MQNNINSYEWNISNTCKKRNTNVLEYDIEAHLKRFRDTKRFDILYNCWIIEKNEYINRLSTVGMTYQTYSLHDATHSETILRQIAYFLGEERIRQLSPTDAWLILECAYCHDLGMVVTAKDLYHELAALEKEDFDDFSQEMYKSENKDVRISWAYLEPLFLYARRQTNHNTSGDYNEWDKGDSAEKRKNRDGLVEIYNSDWYKWPVYFVRAFMILIQERCRPKHGVMSYAVIKKEAEEKSYEGLIPLRFRRLIAEIAAIHMDERRNVIGKLSPKIQGFDGDYAHPRFVAELIRIGDLLDMDNNRFNQYQLAVAGNISYNSFTHQLKHRAVGNFLVTPEVIKVEANFTTEDAKEILQGDSLRDLLWNFQEEDTEYCADSSEARTLVNDNAVILALRSFKEMSGWLQMLHQELDFFCKEWLNITPENLTGNCPYFGSEILRFNGEYIENDLLELRYHITAKRASEIIEGIGLYEDIFVAFIREILQNSMDAIKRKIFLEIKTRMKDDFDNPLEFYKYISRDMRELAIQVYCINLSDKVIRLQVRDYGIGITYERLRGMQHIGDEPDSRVRRQAKKMPAWWKPTGSFGIGMQSIFNFTKVFKLKTRTEEEKLLRKMSFHSTQIGGKIDAYVLNDSEEAKAFRFGTEVEIDISIKMMRLLQESGWFGINADYFGDTVTLFQNKIREAIKHIQGSFGIPIILYGINSMQKDNDLYTGIDAEQYLIQCFGNYFIKLESKGSEQTSKIVKVFEQTNNAVRTNCYSYSGFSCWSKENHILLRYRWQKERQKKHSLKIYFNEIRVDDDSLINMIPISFLDVEIYLFDKNAENFLEVNRDRFLYEKRRHIVDLICNTHLKCMQYLSKIQDENEETKEGRYKQAIWKEREDWGCYGSSLKEYFKFLLNKQDIKKQMLGVHCFFQRADMIYPIKQNLPLSSFPIKKEEVWLIDMKYRSISDVQLVETYSPRGRYIVEDLFFGCMDLAITELACMKEFSGGYTIIYKVDYRSERTVTVDRKDFLIYIEMRYHELMKKGEKLGRILLPGAETYRTLCVYRLLDNMGTLFEKKWNSAIILPVTLEELQQILEQSEEIQAEKLLEEFLTEEQASYGDIIKYIGHYGIIREQKKEDIKKAYKELLLEIWRNMGARLED